MPTRWSYACGLQTRPYIYQTVPDRLRILAEEEPRRDAFVFYNEAMERASISRQELYERSRSLAKVLVGLGLKKGQTVGFCMNNSMEMLISIMAVITAGGIPFFMATNLKDGSDIVETMTDMEAFLLFIDTNQDDDNWAIVRNILSLNGYHYNLPSLQFIVCNGIDEKYRPRILALSKLLQETIQNETLPKSYPEDALLYFCTSGSTGKPKAVIVTHFSLLNWTQTSNDALKIYSESIHFCDRSFSWGVGFPKTYLTTGATRVFVDTKMSLSGDNVKDICGIIHREQCDVVYIPNYITVDLDKNQHLSSQFDSVRVVYCSGERLTTETLVLKDKFCKELYFYYGSTEAAGVSSFTSKMSEDYEDGMIGLPVEGMEMKIVDSSGRVVKAGESGELYTRSAYRFVGYHGQPEKFNEVVDEKNWYHTGDNAHMREDGCFVMEGRSKELISVQTNKFFPWDIERIMKKCKGVKYAVAVGVPDQRLTQVICVCIVADTVYPITEGDVLRFCDETFLNQTTANRLSLKPRHILLFDELPLTRVGKIDRQTIAAIARQRLNL